VHLLRVHTVPEHSPLSGQAFVTNHGLPARLPQAVYVDRSLNHDRKLVMAQDAAATSLARVAAQGELARVSALGEVVAGLMGGPATSLEELTAAYHALTGRIKTRTRSPFIPLGALSVGGSRHRALLFKLLSTSVGVRARVLRGRPYAAADDAAVVVVDVQGSEWRLDVMENPGRLMPPGNAARSNAAATQPALHATRGMESPWAAPGWAAAVHTGGGGGG